MSRKFVWGAVLVIISTTFLSGPLVPQVDFAREPPTTDRMFCESSGSASVEVTDFPGGRTAIERQQFGVQKYELSVPDVLVSVEELQGCPVVIYELEIPSLGYVSVRRVYPVEGRTEKISLSIVGGRFNPGEITEDSYDGRAVVIVAGDRRRTVFSRNLTIPVVE